MTVASTNISEQSASQSAPPSNGAATPAQCPAALNVSTGERWFSSIIGSMLVMKGLKMRTIPGAIMATVGGAMVHRGVTGHCMGYAALRINHAPGVGAPPRDYSRRGVHVNESITIGKSPNELYQFWRNFENLPRIMSHLKSVKLVDERRSRWTAKAPAGLSVAWEAEIINDVPGEKIAWRSLYPATINNAGTVRFAEAPQGRGTEVVVTLDYIPPAGNVGWLIAKIFASDPATEVREDLRRFKAVMETGEAPTTKGQSHGKRTMIGALLAAD